MYKDKKVCYRLLCLYRRFIDFMENKKQNTICKSSSEAEYQAMASTSAEIHWLMYLLADFKIKHGLLALLFCDNISGIHIAKKTQFFTSGQSILTLIITLFKQRSNMTSSILCLFLLKTSWLTCLHRLYILQASINRLTD